MDNQNTQHSSKSKEADKRGMSLRDEIFTAAFERRFFVWYRRVFSIAEIENSNVLKWFFGATLFSFYITFSNWIGNVTITTEAVANNFYTCWPYFQSCGDWYFLSALPYGYSQTMLYMFFFGLMTMVVYLIWKREFVLAHILVTILFVWKFFAIFILTDSIAGNYDYYHIVLTLILLFFPFKVFFLKLSFVLLYFLSSTIKIHEGWILGTYFTALQTGLPVFPDAIAPFITNLVIFMEMVGAWFLLSSNKLLQRSALVFFIIFHLYSGILVEFRYPATVLPALLILFGPLYRVTPVPIQKKALWGWIFISMLFIFQFLSILIPGDEKITLEGNKYGLYMFEANHQCISTVNIYKKDGTVENNRAESALARSRCDPYRRWFALQQICSRDKEVTRIEWQFDHSINGGPFYRIVDEQNVCSLNYKPLGHNEWIRTPEDGAPRIGYPVKNVYY